MVSSRFFEIRSIQSICNGCSYVVALSSGVYHVIYGDLEFLNPIA
jgi:hypothetical protein